MEKCNGPSDIERDVAHDRVLGKRLWEVHNPLSGFLEFAPIMSGKMRSNIYHVTIDDHEKTSVMILGTSNPHFG